jgi:hypothetical protein
VSGEEEEEERGRKRWRRRGDGRREGGMGARGRGWQHLTTHETSVTTAVGFQALGAGGIHIMLPPITNNRHRHAVWQSLDHGSTASLLPA